MVNPFLYKIILVGNTEFIDAIEYVYEELNIVKKTESVIEAIDYLKKGDGLIICCEKKPEYLYKQLDSYGLKIGGEYIGVNRLIEWMDIFRVDYLPLHIQEHIRHDGFACWGDKYETDEFLIVNEMRYVYRIPTAEMYEAINTKKFIVITASNFTEMINALSSNGKVEGRDFIYYKDIRNVFVQSQMFRKVIEDKRKYNFICDAPSTYAQFEAGGNVKFCCLGLKANSGNLNENSFDGIWNSFRSRIIRLSILSGKYTFCDETVCPYLINRREMDYQGITYVEKRDYPNMVNVSLDHTCNLFCDHCRSHVMVANVNEQKEIDHFCNIVISEVVPKVNRLLLAGNGEIFFSKAYRKIIENDQIGNNALEVAILSNGMLFDEEHFRTIKIKNKSIGVSISVDACTAKTYESIRRGGDFERLLKNLEYISQLRNNNEIVHFQLNYVVRSDNVAEMGEFVELGKKLNVDVVRFVKLENWIFTSEEFSNIDIFCGDRIKENYKKYFEDARLQDPIVDLRNLKKYMNDEY